FLHHMLTGHYPVDAADGVPPYLSEDGYDIVAERRDALTLVDGTMTQYLRTLPDASVSAFALSNIGEWLGADELDELFVEVVRTATPGARLCFRNFVGWTEVPPRFRDSVVEDRERGEAMIRRDRSVVQRRFAVCRINRVGAPWRPNGARIYMASTERRSMPVILRCTRSGVRWASPMPSASGRARVSRKWQAEACRSSSPYSAATARWLAESVVEVLYLPSIA